MEDTSTRTVGGVDVPVSRAAVEYPAHPIVHQKPDDHYKILLHALGQVDLTATPEGLEVIARYKADADLNDAVATKPPRVPEHGELPPSHLQGLELNKWLERQRTQALLPDDDDSYHTAGKEHAGRSNAHLSAAPPEYNTPSQPQPQHVVRDGE